MQREAVNGLQVLGYMLVFAIPIVTAALLLPSYALWIVLVGLVLFLLVSAFFVGWQWEDPQWTRAARMVVRLLPFLAVLTVVIAALSDLIRERQNLTQVAIVAGISVGFVALMLPAFYLGRVMYRRRGSSG